MGSDREQYEEFVGVDGRVPIFMRPWWLDAVCGRDGWDVVIYEKGGQTVGALPYHTKRRYGLSVISMPKLTPVMGPVIKYFEGQKRASRLSHEKEVFTELIQGLPSVTYFVQNFRPGITNWLPFFWEGFTATVRYTYTIDDIEDTEHVWDGFDSRIRRMIRKADDRDVTVEKSEDLDTFLKLNRMTYRRQGRQLPYSEELVWRLDEVCRGRDARHLYLAKGESGVPHSALYCVSDSDATYYLMSGANPELRNSGANGLATWRSIEEAASRGCTRYDFAGSMVEDISRFFRDFGGEQVPYIQVLSASRLGLTLKGIYTVYKSLIGTDATASNLLP